MTIHPEPSPLVGRTVTVDLGDGPMDFRVEDWWDRAAGMSWMVAEGNPAALNYALRTGLGGLKVPIDDEVLYGKDPGGRGHLVHVSEIIGEVVVEPSAADAESRSGAVS